MKIGLLDIFQVLLSIASIVVGIIYQNYRIIAWVGSGVLFLIAAVIKSYSEISELQIEQQKQREKLNIYKELIDIKADIQLLKEERNNARKRTN